MHMFKGFGSSLMGALGDIKDNYMNKVYELNGRRYSVKKLIAEGGFGFVFLVRDDSQRPFALKRMLVQERERMAVLKREVDIMASLSNCKHVVRLLAHTVVESREGTEVLLLMELCNGSVLDMMNQRHDRRLGEAEVLNILAQVCQGVESMHALKPPVAHRDIKVENVLVSEGGPYKLCDFGSATSVTYQPTNERERGRAEEDISKNTTMTYRAPEMVDLWRAQLINEKVDIWALGCLLYKMVFFVDAFEASLGILNCRYHVPEHPPCSQDILDLIAFMLVSDPEARPDIFQVQERIARLRNAPYQRPEGARTAASPKKAPPPAQDSRQQRPKAAEPSPQHHHQQPAQGISQMISFTSDSEAKVSPTTPHAAAPVQHQMSNSFHTRVAHRRTQSSTASSTMPSVVAPKPQGPAKSLFDTLEWHSQPSSPADTPVRGRSPDSFFTNANTNANVNTNAPVFLAPAPIYASAPAAAPAPNHTQPANLVNLLDQDFPSPKSNHGFGDLQGLSFGQAPVQHQAPVSMQPLQPLQPLQPNTLQAPVSKASPLQRSPSVPNAAVHAQPVKPSYQQPNYNVFIPPSPTSQRHYSPSQQHQAFAPSSAGPDPFSNLVDQSKSSFSQNNSPNPRTTSEPNFFAQQPGSGGNTPPSGLRDASFNNISIAAPPSSPRSGRTRKLGSSGQFSSGQYSPK